MHHRVHAPCYVVPFTPVRLPFICPQGGWQNIVLARILAEMGFYHPYKSLPSISCPVFFRAATR